MAPPTDEELLEAVKRIKVGDYSENGMSVEELRDRINDDYFMWNVSVEQVAKALEVIEKEREDEYVPPEGTFEMFPDRLRPILSISDHSLQFFDIQGIHHSQGGLGSRGVYFLIGKHSLYTINTPNGLAQAVCVLKLYDQNSVDEVFASHLLRYLGLKAPRIRPLTMKQFKNLTWRLRSVKPTMEGTCASLHEKSLQEKGGMIMEFSTGQTMKDSLYNALIKSDSARKTVLTQLGKIIAADMLLNNFDRIPFIWRGEGNLENILVEEALRESDPEVNLIPIDQTYTPIQSEIQREDYLQRVRDSLTETKWGSTVGKHILKLKSFILTVSDEKIKAEDMKVINKGIMAACRAMVAQKRSRFLKELWDATLQDFRGVDAPILAEALSDGEERDFSFAKKVLSEMKKTVR